MNRTATVTVIAIVGIAIPSVGCSPKEVIIRQVLADSSKYFSPPGTEGTSFDDVTDGEMYAYGDWHGVEWMVHSIGGELLGY